jgi:uncharacterized RDD family membrane protein YckC
MAEEVLKNSTKSKKLQKIIESEPALVVGDAAPNSNLKEEYTYVGFFPRFGARIIDFIIYFIIYFLVSSFIIVPILQNRSGISDDTLNSYNNDLQNSLNQLISNNQLSDADLLQSRTDCVTLFQNDPANQALCGKVNDLDKQSFFVELLVMSLLSITYFVLMGVSKTQGTLGKKWFKIKIVNKDNQQISLLQSFAREAFWICNGIFLTLGIYYQQALLIYLLILLLILCDSLRVFFSDKKQSFHDELADTYVVKIKETF